MKNALILLFVILAINPLSAQEITGKKDISNWTIFSGFKDKPQYKKIDNETFFAYYRTSPDDAGIMVLDTKLNVIKDIPLKITKNKRIIYNTKSYLNLLSYPTYYYTKDNNSVVLLGYIKITDKDYAVVGLTYSLTSESLTKVDTLTHAQSDHFTIKLSADEKYFAVCEFMKRAKGTKTDKKIQKQQFDVFTSDCQKRYSIKLDVPKDADEYMYLLSNGELITSTINEESKKMKCQFNKFDTSGTLIGTVDVLPGDQGFYGDIFMQFLESPTHELYCVYSNANGVMHGVNALQIDFAKSSYKKVIDKTLDDSYLAKIYQNVDITHSMIDRKKIKPVKDLFNFYVHSAYVDKDGIYVILQDQKTKVFIPSRGGESSITYSSENLIVMGFGYDGKVKWSTPIKRDAEYKDIQLDGKQINLYNPNGSGIGICPYEDENNINLIVPSMGKIYATRINKTTGKDVVPVLLNDEKSTYTNSNCLLWLNPNQVVITTMKGIYFFFSTKVVQLNSIKVTL